MAENSALDKSNGMNALDLIKKIASMYNINVEVGKGVVPAEITKGGFPLVHFSPWDAINYLAQMCTCNTKKG